MQAQADVEEAVRQAVTEMCKLRPMTIERCQPMMKRIKVIAKRGDSNVEAVYGVLWDALSHGSQTRLASLMLCEVLFSRSKKFRQLLTERFPEFIEAVVAPGKTLPAPQEFAERLRALALHLIPTWLSTYGGLYPQLGVAAKYLRELDQLPPDPNEATPSTANRHASATDAIGEQQQSEQQDPMDSFVCDAKNALESATTCLQCNIMLLQWMKIPIPGNLHWIVENPQHTTSTTQAANAQPDVASDIMQCDTQGVAVDFGNAMHGDEDQGFQFEDVEWDQEANNMMDVADPEPCGTGDKPSRARRKIPDSIRQAVAEALREGQRSIQKVHLPRLRELLSREAVTQAHDSEAQSSVCTATAVPNRPSKILLLRQQLKQLQEAAVDVCKLLITQQDRQEALLATAGGIEEPGTAGCGPQRKLRGRNERLWPEAPPRPVQGSTIRDPAAPVVGNPWTLSFGRVGSPQSQAVLRTPAAATSVKGTACGDTQSGESSKPNNAGGSGVATQVSTIKPGALESILKRAPKLPAGAYLKLWESSDVQREYLQQHMTQGQMHSHWGRVDDVINLDASQIENMLASRTVYHADVSSSLLQKRKADAASKGTHNCTQGPEDVKQRKAEVSDAAVETGAPSNVGRQGNVGGLGDEELSVPAVECPKGTRKVNQGQHVELQAVGMSQKERTAAAKEHNKRVLAAAGLAAVGRHEAIDESSTDGQVQKKKKCGGTLKKLEKMMSKKKWA